MEPQKSHDQAAEEITFVPSPRYTLGVEVELQTLDRNTLNLAPLAPYLLSVAPPLLRPRLTEELIQSILEIKTGICFALADVDYDLQQTCSLAEELAAENGAVLHCSSLHPFAAIEDQVLADNPRYRKIIDELQLVGRQFISQGFHVHVGMPDAETATRVLNAIQYYLPIFLAASGSSPFFQGHDTGFSSYRTKLFELLPLSGIYSHFADWAHFLSVVSQLIHYGIIDSVHDLWWDARLKPEYGTVEIRICDLPGRFSDMLALVAMMQCLVATLAEKNVSYGPCDPYVLQANKWQAARHGLQGRFIDPSGLLSDKPIDMKTALQRMVERLRPMSVRLGCEDYLALTERILVDDTAAVLLRGIYQETGELKESVRRLYGEFWK